MKRINTWRWMGAVLLCNALAACGGGDSPSNKGEASGPATVPVSFSLSAGGTSASTAALSWHGGDADTATRYRIERRQGLDGTYAAVAEVMAGDGLFLDRGLEAASSYAYRVVRIGTSETVLAEGVAQTSDAAPLVIAAGTPVGEARSVNISSGAIELSSDDGSLTLQLPADPQRAAGAATVQRLGNSLPDGRGDAVRVVLPSRPTTAVTVRTKYSDADDADAAAQRLAIRNDDGSWLLLPASSIDMQGRVITTVVPAAAFLTGSSLGLAKTAASSSAAAGPVTLDLGRLVAVRLQPEEASVRVGGTLRFMPYAVYQSWHSSAADDDCTAWLCLPTPVLTRRELPLLNTKAGYVRGWKVDGVAGGDSLHGTVTLQDPAGAIYSAPWTRPNPATVTVSFNSKHLASGRTMTLSAKVHIEEDAWTGPMSFVLEASDQPAGYYYAADTRWVLDPTTSTAQRRVYRAQGFIEVDMHAGQCEITANPNRQALGPDLGLSELVVDESKQPATYTLQLYAMWDATWYYNCAPGVSTRSAMAALWDVSGEISGGEIAGSAQESPVRKTWRLKRPQ